MPLCNFSDRAVKAPEPVRTVPSIRKIMQDSRLEKIPVEKVFLAEHYPFEAYEDYELTDLIEEIRENGVIVPVVARETGAGFEIIDGRARFLAAKEVGDKFIAARIIDCSDGEAVELIEHATKIYQKSFRDMRYSQQARIIARYYETLKKQGMRNDLILRAQHGEDRMGYEIREEVTKERKKKFHYMWTVLGHKYKAYDVRDEVAKKYRLSGRSIARYLRIDKLTNGLKKYLDDEAICFTAAVELSFLNEESQLFVEEAIADGAKVTILNANKLKSMAAKRSRSRYKMPPLEREDIRSVFFMPEKPEKKSAAAEKEHTEPYKSHVEVQEFLYQTYPEYFEPDPDTLEQKPLLIRILLGTYHRLRNALYKLHPEHFPLELTDKEVTSKIFSATILYFRAYGLGKVKPPSPEFGI